MRIETLAVVSGGETDPETGAIAPPIHLSTTFEHGPAGERQAGFEYVREANPTQQRLETMLADLEGGEAALAFASGQAAMYALLMSLPEGAHAIVPDSCYTGLRMLCEDFLPEKRIRAQAVDTTDVAAVTAAFTGDTRLLWLETPSNPMLDVSDIAVLAELAHARGALVACDNTFATPVLQRPFALGADVVVHSTTKYFGGHSDVQGGALVFARRDGLHEDLFHRRHITGGVGSPFNAWLILRGARSLPARMAWHCRNALAVAEWLQEHPAVSAVHYPGLPDHPGHALASRQMSGFGGMLSLRVGEGREAALRVASRLRIIRNATSLGGCETLIEHRASVEGPQPRSPQNLLRLSVGLEHADDLIADLAQALG
jgi:cystathionine gamma-synthase